MFTGIVELVGTITEARAVASGRRLRVRLGDVAGECAVGASLCVSGVCLTVAVVAPPFVEFDVVPETLQRSTLGTKRVGAGVNIERSLRVGDRLDGHFVQGHVDGMAVVDRIETSTGQHGVWFRPDPSLLRFVIPKGSVALDGVSLTIAEIDGDRFSVALIPTTLQRTTLSALLVGDRVNVETDILIRTLVHRQDDLAQAGSITWDRLQRAGFA